MGSIAPAYLFAGMGALCDPGGRDVSGSTRPWKPWLIVSCRHTSCQETRAHWRRSKFSLGQTTVRWNRKPQASMPEMECRRHADRPLRVDLVSDTFENPRSAATRGEAIR